MQAKGINNQRTVSILIENHLKPTPFNESCGRVWMRINEELEGGGAQKGR